MKNLRREVGALASAIAAGALTACVGLTQGSPYERAAELPADSGEILFKAGTVGDRPAKRIQYLDNEQRVEYALYKGNGAQAEFIYMERPYSLNVVFNFGYTIADKVATWNYSKGQPIQWSPAARIRTKVGDVFYRPYRLTARNQECVGVSGEWDPAPDDREQRKTRIMFGYYCAPRDRTLADTETASLINGIGLRGATGPASNRLDAFDHDVAAVYAGLEGSRRAIGAAQGADDSAGSAEFPFRYAEYYDTRHGHGGQ